VAAAVVVRRLAAGRGAGANPVSEVTTEDLSRLFQQHFAHARSLVDEIKALQMPERTIERIPLGRCRYGDEVFEVTALRVWVPEPRGLV
jgi:hypothetical protein